MAAAKTAGTDGCGVGLVFLQTFEAEKFAYNAQGREGKLSTGEPHNDDYDLNREYSDVYYAYYYGKKMVNRSTPNITECATVPPMLSN